MLTMGKMLSEYLTREFPDGVFFTAPSSAIINVLNITNKYLKQFKWHQYLLAGKNSTKLSDFGAIRS